jgi:nitrate reductase NapD
MPEPAPSRRDILTGRVVDADRHPARELHVASLVLHVRPENVSQVLPALADMPGVEVPGASGGKLIVTLETVSEGDIVTRMNEMSLLPGVLSAALVFHHFETEPVAEATHKG